jgi:hypothetical protein
MGRKWSLSAGFSQGRAGGLFLYHIKILSSKKDEGSKIYLKVEYWLVIMALGFVFSVGCHLAFNILLFPVRTAQVTGKFWSYRCICLKYILIATPTGNNRFLIHI